MSENDEEMVLINIRVNKKQRKALKLIAAEKEVTVTDLITGFIDELIDKHDK